MVQGELNNAVHTSVFTTWLDASGICMTVVKKNGVIGLSEAQENTEAVEKVSNKKILPLLVDLRDIKSINKQARDHFAMNKRRAGVSAIAMLIKSPVSKVIGNFFLGINMPSVPTQLFNSEEKAISWLKQYIVKS